MKELISNTPTTILAVAIGSTITIFGILIQSFVQIVINNRQIKTGRNEKRAQRNVNLRCRPSPLISEVFDQLFLTKSFRQNR